MWDAPATHRTRFAIRSAALGIAIACGGSLAFFHSTAAFRAAEPEAKIAARPFVRAWTREELEPRLGELAEGRDFVRGQKLWVEAACRFCHQMRGDGGLLGPELTDYGRRVPDRRELLAEMLEPSRKIDPRFRTRNIALVDGRVVAGIVSFENDQVLRVMCGSQEECRTRELKKAEIEEISLSPVSLMPQGLLNTLTLPEILDLLAYVAAGGDPAHPAFKAR